LVERGVIVVIATANPDEVEAGDREHVLGIVNKPYSAIHAALRYAVEKLQRSDAEPAEPPPSV
jgi:hypothetical protein